jgi:hypothetical protein
MKHGFFISSFRVKKWPFILLVNVLLMLVYLNLESIAMDVVDRELMEQFDSAGNRPVSVIITCQSKCHAVIKALEEAGIRITNTESMVLGSIAAEITKDQLSFLQTVAGISAIEYNHEVRTFD